MNETEARIVALLLGDLAKAEHSGGGIWLVTKNTKAGHLLVFDNAGDSVYESLGAVIEGKELNHVEFY